MSKLLYTTLELGEVCNGDGDPLYDEAIIYFHGQEEELDIMVRAPNALAVAEKIVERWNAALSANERQRG
jgi:hypothetical protein